MPFKLIEATEAASAVGLITSDRLLELAEAGFLPHYRVDGGPALFRLSEVRAWILENLVVHESGNPLPRAIRLVVNAPPTSQAPQAISNLPHLQELAIHDVRPGIYFLCKGDEVVYVGQSLTPQSRVISHIRTKDFDSAFFMPVPASEMNEFEAAMILHLKPSQQGRTRSGRLVVPVHLSQASAAAIHDATTGV